MEPILLHVWSPKNGGWVQSIHRPRVDPSCGRADAWTHQPPIFFSFFFLDKSRKLSKILLVLQSASVERFDVSRMRDFFIISSQKKCSILRPLLSSTFPQGFRISKNFGHPTSESGGKMRLKIYYAKRDRQTDTHTHTRTSRLLDRIGPVGRFDENHKQSIVGSLFSY